MQVNTGDIICYDESLQQTVYMKKQEGTAFTGIYETNTTTLRTQNLSYSINPSHLTFSDRSHRLL